MNKFIHFLITSVAFLIIPLGFFFGFTTYPHYAAYVLEGYLSILLPIVLITLLIKNYLPSFNLKLFKKKPNSQRLNIVRTTNPSKFGLIR